MKATLKSKYFDGKKELQPGDVIDINEKEYKLLLSANAVEPKGKDKGDKDEPPKKLSAAECKAVKKEIAKMEKALGKANSEAKDAIEAQIEELKKKLA